MKTTELSDLLAPVVGALGLEIDRIEVLPAGRRKVVRVFLDGDGPDGRGPSLDNIADATRAISASLDESDITGAGPYTLEVSSRGVGRPLTDPKHFRRNRGRLVQVRGADLAVTGRITDATSEHVVLDVAGVVQAVAYPDIDEAVVEVEFNRPLDGDDQDEES
ncbi:MAG: ribosome maturation factor RimP [Propionibacteriaceae bacterium]|nr:ribosome maturation factor RimP [Propionibacteriaceae bacterium]